MSKELFSVYHCKACNKIEVSQYISKEEMEELGFTEEELKPNNQHNLANRNNHYYLN